MNGELYPGEFEAMEHNGRMDAVYSEEMSRETAIERLKSIKSLVELYDDIVALRMAIAALSAEPKLRQGLEQEKGAYNALVKSMRTDPNVAAALESLREETASLKEIEYDDKTVESEVHRVIDAILGSIDWYINDLKAKRIAEIKGTEG